MYVKCLVYSTFVHFRIDSSFLQVGIGRDRTLFAMEHGRLFVTTEAINPNWNQRHVKEAYEGRKGHTILKMFVHIHPDPQPQKFRLVSHI